MFEDFIVKLGWVSVLVTVLVAIGLMIKLRTNFKLMLLLIPFLVLTTGIWVWIVNDQAGKPRYGEPEDGAVVLKIIEDKPKWIYLWVLEEGKHRLYKIDWDEKKGKQARGTRDEMEGQGRKFKYKRRGHKIEHPDNEKMFYQFKLQDYIKKQPGANNY